MMTFSELGFFISRIIEFLYLNRRDREGNILRKCQLNDRGRKEIDPFSCFDLKMKGDKKSCLIPAFWKLLNPLLNSWENDVGVYTSAIESIDSQKLMVPVGAVTLRVSAPLLCLCATEGPRRGRGQGGNTRTRSRGRRQALVLNCWQVRGWAPDCYHWIRFHNQSLLNCFARFYRRARVCVQEARPALELEMPREQKGVNQSLVTPLQTPQRGQRRNCKHWWRQRARWQRRCERNETLRG